MRKSKKIRIEQKTEYDLAIANGHISQFTLGHNAFKSVNLRLTCWVLYNESYDPLRLQKELKWGVKQILNRDKIWNTGKLIVDADSADLASYNKNKYCFVGNDITLYLNEPNNYKNDKEFELYLVQLMREILQILENKGYKIKKNKK